MEWVPRACRLYSSTTAGRGNGSLPNRRRLPCSVPLVYALQNVVEAYCDADIDPDYDLKEEDKVGLGVHQVQRDFLWLRGLFVQLWRLLDPSGSALDAHMRRWKRSLLGRGSTYTTPEKFHWLGGSPEEEARVLAGRRHPASLPASTWICAIRLLSVLCPVSSAISRSAGVRSISCPILESMNEYVQYGMSRTTVSLPIQYHRI